ncbi:ABC1 family protein C10F6.14c [Erysiphe neolycopersici]|uniref:ABC1 family protein C10F6.14c n=1 Tax=Erysiphe neolycopersici TaxID=212602 RepID=A0A420HRS6_9PEZI|nr:ABC1 family protein C10F6.14c [Erysiphe neolycopersici]
MSRLIRNPILYRSTKNFRWTQEFSGEAVHIAKLGTRNIFALSSASQSLSQERKIRSSTRLIQTQYYQPFAPPSPDSLGKPIPAKQYRGIIKWGQRFIYVFLGLGTAYFIDDQFYASSITRSLRTFWTGLLIAIDYKLNFRPDPWFGGDIADLHHRSAERIFILLHRNGGLYLKIGQAIAMQSAILPPEFQKMFTRMFDDAPQNDWKDVEKVIREEFGKSPEEVFGVSVGKDTGNVVIERKARASASVAQVHWARLADGKEVAIKIQKREIAQQVGWDLWAFNIVTRIYSFWFNLPLDKLVPYISERLQLETDFTNEVLNAERMKCLVANEPRLRDRVYIPKIYPDLSTKRVMTTEWIEGVRFWDKDVLTAPWKGNLKASSDVSKESLFVPRISPQNDNGNNLIKPERDEWRGPNRDGGLGISRKEVMSIMIDLFSAQMFLWGLVHCDPHPGNIFIRRRANGHPELVLIDHGLYVSLNPKLRSQYCQFWKAILTFDNKTINEITKSWGMQAPDLFASATLMRPYEGGDSSTKLRIVGELKGETAAERHYEVQERMRQGIRELLADLDLFPRELLFIGRNMRIVQGNNQFLGSPVNRIKLTGLWASRSLVESKDLTFGQYCLNAWRHLMFRVMLFSSDLAFYTSRIRQIFGLGEGFEDDIEKQMKFIAKDQFGLELQHSVFEG